MEYLQKLGSILFIVTLLIANICYSKDYRDKILPEDNYIKGFVDIGKCKIHYEMKGERTPLVLIHAGMLDKRMWEPQFGELSKHFKVLMYDARNHGITVSEPDTFSHHDDLAKLLERLGIQKAVIMGLSMGGYIAVNFALDYPEKTIAIIPVCSGLTGYQFVDSTLNENQKRIKQARTYEDVVECIQRSWTDGPLRTPSQIDSTVRNKAKQMYLETLLKFNKKVVEKKPENPAINRLFEINKPALIITADLDISDIFKIADKLNKEIRNSQRIEIKGAAHLVNMEKPEEFNRIIIDYIKSIESK